MGPHAGQPGKQILVLRQFNLELPFPCSRALGKDVQNEAGTIQNPDPEILGQNPHLGRGELVVKDREIAVVQRDQRFHFRDLSVADEAAGIGRRPVLNQRNNDLAAGGFDQGRQLFHGAVRGALGAVHAERVQPGQNRTFFSGFCAFYGNQAFLSNEHNSSIIYHATI